MYILKNALKNITRSKGRTILIGIIVLVIAASSAVTLAIRNAADKAAADGLAKLSITATITVDRQSILESARTSGTDMRTALQGLENLPLDTQKSYAASSYVKAFTYTTTTSVNADSLTAVSATTATTNANTRTLNGAQQTDPNAPREGFGTQGSYTLVGASAQEAISGFTAGTTTLAAGSLPDFTSSAATCLISSELATLNNLAVGDVITIINPNQTTQTYTLTIAGIYKSADASASTQIAFNPGSDNANRIYASAPAVEKIAADSTANATTSISTSGTVSTTALRTQTSGTFAFASKADYEGFAQELKDKGLDSKYTLTSTDLQAFENSLKPLQNISSFAMVFLAVVLAIGSIILIVLNIYNIRERKYEVGVLTAIGMKKWKVGLQFVTEIFLSTFLFILLGTAAGAALSVPVADNLLASAVTQTQTASAQPGPGGAGGFNRGGTFAAAGAGYIDQINASVNLTVLAELAGIGFLLAVVSSGAGVFFIMRYEPLKILSERS